MIGSRFTKAFQLIALVLAFSVVQVYVMAGPIKSSTDPRTTDTSASQPKAEDSGSKVATANTETLSPTPEAAAEKMTLRIGSKSVLAHIFSKSDVEARLAASNTFLKANTSLANSFKAPKAQTSSTQTSSKSDDSDNGSRSTWIAVGVIGAVLAVAFIGLRHDRTNGNQ
jgi:hypothetical protein